MNDPYAREPSSTFYSIEKFQYQKTFNERSYLRFLTYMEYSNWFFTGFLSAQLPFAMYPLIRFTSDRRVMGVFANGPAMRGSAWISLVNTGRRS